jgi:hypothetical protein
MWCLYDSFLQLSVEWVWQMNHWSCSVICWHVDRARGYLLVAYEMLFVSQQFQTWWSCESWASVLPNWHLGPTCRVWTYIISYSQSTIKYKFYVHVTVLHRNKFLYIKTNQMHQFPSFTPAWNSTCFGQFLCPWSGVYSLYTRHLYMPYKFVDSFRAGPGWNFSKAVFKRVWHIPVPSVQWNPWW